MTRTAIRYTLSALATAGFSLALFSQPAASDPQQTPKLDAAQLQWGATMDVLNAKPVPKGLAAQQEPPRIKVFGYKGATGSYTLPRK